MFKTSIKTEWKLFILARNPCAILARPQWELARGQFFKLSLRDLARPCAKMNSWDLVHFCLRDAGTKLISDLSFLASQILGSLGCFSASRLLGLSGGFSTSRLQSTQFLFCQQCKCSPWMPPVSVWPWARVQSVQWHGSQSVQWFCLVSRSERA